MRRFGRATIAAVLLTGAVLASPSIAGQGVLQDASNPPVDPCELYPCQEGETSAVYTLPDSVAHYPCNPGDGQAPAGVADETTDLQAWIDSVPDGGEQGDTRLIEWHLLVFPAGRCIRVDGHLLIRDRRYLIFVGEGVTLDQHLKPASGRRHPSRELTWNGSGGWHVIRGSFLQWRSFKIVGNHQHSAMQTVWAGGDKVRQTKVTTYGLCHEQVPKHPSCEWQAAWLIMGSQHVTLEGNESRDTHGDGVEIFWDPPRTVNARDILVNNHKIFRAGRQGISTMAVEDLTISNTYIEGAAQNAIDLEPEDSRFPIRRVTITKNKFGESYATTLVANGSCVEVSDISYTHNEQLEPNITGHAAIEMIAPVSCSLQRGPVTITDNKFLIEEVWVENDLAALTARYSNVSFNSNLVRHICHDAIPPDGCAAEVPVSLFGGTGHMVNGNNLAVGNPPHQWQSVYSYNGASHASLGTNVTSCGTTTSRGTDQPNACSLPLEVGTRRR